MLWPEIRQEELKRKIKHLFDLPDRSYCYLHSTKLNSELPKSLSENPFAFEDCNHIVGPSWKQIDIKNSYQKPCLYIITAHGSDISDLVWKIRAQSHVDSVFCLWFWDNHVAYDANFKCTLASDLNFISHNIGVPSYLVNPVSSVVAHIPACSAQFGKNELLDIIEIFNPSDRSEKCLFNYVIYDNAPRSELIKKMSLTLHDVGDFKLMPSNDRTRYWELPREKRLQEWAEYKCCVIFPLVQDLSTRVFDALGTGQIPIIPNNVFDLDVVIPVKKQIELGIVRISNFNDSSIRDAISIAVNNFNDQGVEGVRNRLIYVAENHLLGHRIKEIISTIKHKIDTDTMPKFGIANNNIGVF